MSIVINYTGRNGSGPWHSLAIAKSYLDNGYEVIAIISNSACNVAAWEKIGLKKLILIDTYTNAKSLVVESIKFSARKRIIKQQLCNENIDYIICPMITMWTRKINKIFANVPQVVFVHDFIPHDKKINVMISNFFGYEKVIREADVIAVHSRIYVEAIEKKYNKIRRAFYIPLTELNCYREFSNGNSVILYDREKVNFLFFGRIEEYKGLNLLIEAFKKLLEDNTNITLTIVGSGDISKYQSVLGDISNIYIVNRWIEDDEVHSILSGDNIVMVMPYINASQSGPVLLAKEYNIPCIVTNVGGLSEQIIDNVTGIVVEPNVESVMKGMKEMSKIDVVVSFRQKMEEYRKQKDEKINQAQTINENIIRILKIGE